MMSMSIAYLNTPDLNGNVFGKVSYVHRIVKIYFFIKTIMMVIS